MNLYVDGDSVILSSQLDGGEEDRYPLATVYRGGDVFEAEIGLEHKALGKYDGAWTPAASDRYHVVFQVFTDAARTIEDPQYGREVEFWREGSFLAPPIADAVLREPVGDHSVVAGSLADVISTLEIRLTAARAAALDKIDGIEGNAELARKILRNRLELEPGGTGNWILYDDDDSTPLITWNVKDFLGQNIQLAQFSATHRWPQ